MRHDDLDRVLSEEEGILPSSGFTASVMDAVRREVLTPPPIAFPWRRALPGMAVAVLGLIAALTELGRGAAVPPLPVAQPSRLVPIVEAIMSAGTGWIVLALLLTLASVTLSMRLASGRT